MNYVFVCPEQPTITPGVPPSTACDGGGWVETQTIVGQALEFELSDLNPESLASAFSSGFVLIGLAFVFGRGARALLEMIAR